MFNKLFKSIFAVAMVLGAAVGFVSCQPEEEKVENPTVQVSAEQLNFTNEEGSQTINVTSNANWKTEKAAEWVTVTPTAGKGNKTLTVSVSMNDTGAVRTAEVKVIALHPEWGPYETVKFVVSQSADENATVDEVLLYSDDFDGKEATKAYGDSGSSWPYIDQFPEFANPKGDAAANVTYTGNKVSVRANQPSNQSTYSNYAGSGTNNIFFGNGGYFVVNNIAPLSADDKNYKISFGVQKYAGNDGDSSFNYTDFLLYISKDGENWAPVEYAIADLVDGKYNVATADFTLAASTDKLYIKFVAKVASVLRIDDLKFFVGNGGKTIDLDNIEAPQPGGVVTIAEAIAAADNTAIVIENATVIGVYARGVLVEDTTGKLLVYAGSAVNANVGDVVKVEGAMATYGGLRQVGGTPTVTVTGSTSYTYPTATVMDGAAMDAYLSNPVINYVEYTGTLAINGFYYNVTVDGASTAVGSLAYVIEGTVDASLNGQKILVKGWTIGFSGGKYVSTMITSVTAADGGSTEPTPDPEPGEVMTIADVLAKGDGATIGGVIEGVVVSNMDLNNLTSKKGLYVQDETGALQFYLAANHEFAFGTKVKIDLTTATLGSYNGAVQVSGVGLDKITVVSTDNAVEAKTVSMADFLANKYEGQYIALEGVQVAASDLAKTWVMGGAHTSINIEDANGNKFVVFSSKYATYGTQTVAQGAGTIKGISSINNGNMQIIFAQASDFAGLTGERFGDAGGETPTPEPEPTPGDGNVVVLTMADYFSAAEEIVNTDGTAKSYKFGDYTFSFSKVNSNASNYNASDAGIRFYQSDVMTIDAGSKTMTKIEFETYGGKTGPFTSNVGSVEGTTWTGSASSVELTASAQVRFKSVTITLAE